MALKVKRVDVWAASIEDKPGGLASKLSALAKAGASFEFAFARRDPTRSGTGVVFLTPIKGAKQVQVAKDVGFDMLNSVHSVCVEGTDKAGLASQLADALAGARINVRGFSAASVGGKAVMYLAFDNAQEADNAAKVLQEK